jgi:purine-nucleoside phosphorylase
VLVSTEPLAQLGPGDLVAEQAVAVIRERSSLDVAVAVILGSGLTAVLDGMDEEAAFSFDGLPGFPSTSVPGHVGRVVLGTLRGVQVAGFLGRLHHYEGHPMATLALPVRVARLLGAETVVLAAAVGALDPTLEPGTLVVARDHINLMGEDPLRGWRRPDGTPAFVHLADLYDARLCDLAVREAERLGIAVTTGVYLAVPGPTYETPAEIEFMRRVGGTIVGMSVVPEALPARALGMRVLGLFAVTNAAGAEVEHGAVVRMGDRMSGTVGRLLELIMPRVAARPVDAA